MTKAYEDKADVLRIIVTQYPKASANSILRILKNTPHSISRQVGLRLVKGFREADKRVEKYHKYYNPKTADRIDAGFTKRATLEAKRNKTPEEKKHLEETRSMADIDAQHFPDPDDLQDNRGGT